MNQRFSNTATNAWNRFKNYSAATLLVFGLIFQTAAEDVPGIPEPGLIMYGSVVNIFGGENTRLTSGTLEWTVTPTGGNAITFPVVNLTNINNELSYVVTVPFETVGTGFIDASGVLNLTGSPLDYERLARYRPSANVEIHDVQDASITQALSSFPFSTANRGSIHRVDLTVSFNDDTDMDGLSDQWEIANFGNLNSEAALDPDNDGCTNLEEFIAKTDPNDPNSTCTPNTVPTISSIADQTATAGLSTEAVTFSILDTESAADQLTVSATSSDQNLIPSSNITIAGIGGNRTITFVPASNQSGTATITVRVTDIGGGVC